MTAVERSGAMNPSLDLITQAFGWLHAGSPEMAPARGTGLGLTGPEAAARYMTVVKAVERLPHQPKTWAYYAYMDGKPKGDAVWMARTVCLNVREALRWVDPRGWEKDPAKPDQKKAVVQHIVAAVAEHRPVIDSDIAKLAGQTNSYGVTENRPWGHYRQAVNRVFDAWDKDILDAVSYALDRSRAA